MVGLQCLIVIFPDHTHLLFAGVGLVPSNRTSNPGSATCLNYRDYSLRLPMKHVRVCLLLGNHHRAVSGTTYMRGSKKFCHRGSNFDNVFLNGVSLADR